LSASQVLAAPPNTYDIVEFSCSERTVTGEAVELSVKVRRKGSAGTGTTLTLTGTQDGVGVFADSHTILDTRRDKKAEEAFLFEAVSAGEIQWLATVDGDEAHCTTTVVQGEGGGDDGGGGEPPTASDNIIALHDSGSPQYQEHCLECHVDILSEESMDPAIHGAHMAMRPFVPGENDETKCTWCHRSVDLTAHLLGPQPGDRTSANLNIVLVAPEIPQNTGAIGRLCVCTDTVLHLIRPLGFSKSNSNASSARSRPGTVSEARSRRHAAIRFSIQNPLC